MKRLASLICLVLMLVLVLNSSWATDLNGLLLDDFEGVIAGGKTGTVDFGSGNGSTVEVSASSDIKYSGNQSLKVAYNAIAGGYMWIARGFGLEVQSAWLVKFEDINWKDYNAIAFYMYGANSGVSVAIDIKDNGNEMWRLLIKDDFQGWKQIVLPFSDFYCRGDWQPSSADKNAQLDFPLKSFQFEPLPEAKGTLYFDKVELVK